MRGTTPTPGSAARTPRCPSARAERGAVARQTVADWESYPDMSERHFSELRAMLDEQEPGYKD